METTFGRLLRVDLSNGETEPFAVDPAYVAGFVGGSGLAARLLWDHVTPEIDPLDPNNPLLFITGPLTGTAGPSVGRFVVCARSPRTGLWNESHCGGFWGPELRFAGYDGLFITGRASEPVYLWIRGGRAELRDASHLWGQTDTYTTQSAICEELGQPRARVAAIGPAGEQVILLANIITGQGRAAGRAGMGALMGSKNLKAVAVRGARELPLDDPERYRELSMRTNRELKEHFRSEAQRLGGTASGAEYFELLGDMTARYFSQGAFPTVGQIGGAAMAETLLTGTSACQGCVIGCGRRVRITDGPFAGPEMDGPEYETVCGFGPQLLIDDLSAIVYLGHLCDRFGLDTISTSGTIALAFYLFDQGVIGPQDIGGLELAWGNAKTVARLIDLLVREKGFGALLAQGSLALARHFGVEEMAVQVNGLEAPYHDPRGFSSMALVYTTSPRGACHNHSDYYMVELGQTNDELGITLLGSREEEGKAAQVAVHQDWGSVSNSLVLCLLAAVPVSDTVALLNAATGREWDLAEALHAGRRMWNLKRAINCRLGLTRASERLPKLLLQPLAEGPTEGYVPNLDSMLREYYAVRRWDLETGRPSRETMEGLGLGFAAEALW
jgi:aldehyde:ferredoxin oxidoreductase